MTQTQIIKHDKNFYQRVQAGPMLALQKLDFKEVKSPAHRWKGAKIPLSTWRQILAFFEWSYDHTKSETMAHLYYHPTHGWAAIVLPQKGHTGMEINLIADHPGKAEAEQRLPGVWQQGQPFLPEHNIPWERMGTVHHHCTGGAFRSSGDKNDETTKDGLHITVGDLTKNQYSIHGRSIYNKIETAIWWSDFFDLDEPLKSMLHPDMHEQAIEFELVKSAKKDDPFPEWWKENVIKVTTVASSYDASKLPTHYQGKGNGGYSKHGRGGYSYSSHWLEDDFEKLLEDWRCDVGDIVHYLQMIEQDPFMLQIVEAMADNRADMKDAKEAVRELLQKEVNKTPLEVNASDLTTEQQAELDQQLQKEYDREHGGLNSGWQGWQ